MNRLCLIWIFGAALFAQDAAFLIQGATIIDGAGSPPRVADVLIREGRIAAVEATIDPPSGTQVIPARGKTLTPGLFDLHTHLLASGGPVSADWGKVLKAYLYCGVTTVVDLSTYPEQFNPMRVLVSQGLPAPRLHLAARFSTPGGHGAEAGRGELHTLQEFTPEGIRGAAKRALAMKPDIVKAFTDGWRYGVDMDLTSMEEPTVAALVAESHTAGVKVISHTVTVERGKQASRAGVDIIGHGIGNAAVDDEWLQLMKIKGTGYVQTLAVYEPRVRGDLGSDTLLKAVSEPLMWKYITGLRATGLLQPARKRRWETLLANGGAAGKAGVVLGAGTDAGVTGTYHGWATLRELELLVQSGLTPLEAITAATGNSAKLLGVANERGLIRPGFAADLVLVNGSPQTTIGDFRNIDRVWLGGKEMDRPGLAIAIADPAMTPMTAEKLPALLDDFETDDGRSRIGTVWINNTDPGQDITAMNWARTNRSETNHAMTILTRMSDEKAPSGSMLLPLRPGGIQPADVRAFKGFEFLVRGNGRVKFTVQRRAVRDRGQFFAEFLAGAKWKKVRIPFTELKQPVRAVGVAWTGDDLLAIEFTLAAPAASKRWMEIDEVRLYR